MHRTSKLSVATTQCGMRRILKQKPSPLQYIKWSVETGVHKDLPQNNPRPRTNRRQNRNLNEAPLVNKYPVEYEILSMNPPLPQPVKMTKKEEKAQRKERLLRAKRDKKDKLHRERFGTTTDGDGDGDVDGDANELPTRKYVERYMQRYDARIKASRPLTPAEREDYKYRRTLGIPGKSYHVDSVDMNTAMGRKASVLLDAYEFAMKQYEVVRNQDPDEEPMSEEESVAKVEQLLKMEEREERSKVHANARNVQQWRDDVERKKKDREEEGGAEEETAVISSQAGTDSLVTKPSSSTTSTPFSTIPSILHSKPRTIQALNIWGRRLQAVPYDQWTLGATTALDHWIAVDVLGMDEDSWTGVLSGMLETDVEESMGGDGGGADGLNLGNVARGRDIIAVRSTLFPETLASLNEVDGGEFDGVDVDEFMASADDDDLEDRQQKEYMEATERSIDELLASLGGFDEEDDITEDDTDDSIEGAGDGAEKDGDVSDEDTLIRNMMDGLQEWRRKNQELEFIKWDTAAKEQFNNWLTDYVALVTTENDGEVDLKATRDALLSEPPLTRQESDSFWSRLQDEAQAEILLHNLLKEDDTTDTTTTTTTTTSPVDQKAREAFETFKSLPYSKQLNQLMNVATLRPILDEYTAESERISFMKRYGDLLLEGVEMEHLVPDPDGTITVQDVKDKSLIAGMDKDTRFSIEMIEYGTDQFGTTRSERARELYRAWNVQKAGRAKYEEYLFKSGQKPLKRES